MPEQVRHTSRVFVTSILSLPLLCFCNILRMFKRIMGQHHPSVLATLTHIARVRAASPRRILLQHLSDLFPHCITVTSISAPRLLRPPPPRPPPPAPSPLSSRSHARPKRRRNNSRPLQATLQVHPLSFATAHPFCFSLATALDKTGDAAALPLYAPHP